MTEQPEANGAPHASAEEPAPGIDELDLGKLERDALLSWVGQNLTLVRQSATGQRDFYWILGTGFVVGLAAHVGGFLLKTAVTTEPAALLADLLYALGWALWTSIIVVMFVEIWPAAKRRQYQQALDAYEAAIGRQGRVGRQQAADLDSAEDA